MKNLVRVSAIFNQLIALVGLFEVLRTSQPYGFMSSAVSLPNYTFTGQAESSKRLTCIVHILSPETDNSAEGKNDRRKYFMINLHERMLPTSAGVEPATSWSPVGRRIQVSHRGGLALVGRLSLSEGWENGPERELKTVSFSP